MKNLEDYCPEEPYIIQSGSRKGEVLELLMFKNYGFLNWHLKKIRKNHRGGPLNRYHLHLEWLMAKGENRTPQMDCPICGDRVDLFSVRRSGRGGLFSIGPGYVSCRKEACKNMISAASMGRGIQFYEPKFSNIIRITSSKGRRKDIADLYKSIFGLSTKRLTRKSAFEFFKR